MGGAYTPRTDRRKLDRADRIAYNCFMDNNNIFDVAAVPPTEQDETRGTIVVYSIERLTAASPGWFAVYDDPNRSNEIVVFPICALGVVHIEHERGETSESVRHFVSLPTGEIRDVHEIEDFVCIVAPNQQVEDVVAGVKAIRQPT